MGGSKKPPLLEQAAAAVNEVTSLMWQALQAADSFPELPVSVKLSSPRFEKAALSRVSLSSLSVNARVAEGDTAATSPPSTRLQCLLEEIEEAMDGRRPIIVREKSEKFDEDGEEATESAPSAAESQAIDDQSLMAAVSGFHKFLSDVAAVLTGGERVQGELGRLLRYLCRDPPVWLFLERGGEKVRCTLGERLADVTAGEESARLQAAVDVGMILGATWHNNVAS